MKQKIYSYIRPVGIKFDFINHNFKLEFDDSGLFLVHDRDEDPVLAKNRIWCSAPQTKGNF